MNTISMSGPAGRTLVEVRFNPPSGRKGLGILDLIFPAEINIQPWSDGRAIMEEIRLRVGVRRAGEGRYSSLGIAYFESPMRPETRPFPNKQSNVFVLPVTNYQLGLIEKLRDGGDLEFEVEFGGLITEWKNGEENPRNANHFYADRTTVQANQKTWVGVLGQLDFANIQLIEVRLPTETNNPDLEAAISELHSAQKHYHRGDYSEVVSTCRKALESFTKGPQKQPQLDAAKNQFFDKNMRGKMNKEDRVLLIHEIARHYTHPAHHVDQNGAMNEFSRADAELILRITASLFSHGL